VHDAQTHFHHELEMPLGRRADAARGYVFSRENIVDRITVRRQRHRIAELRPLTFQSNTAEIDVATVSVFGTEDRSVVLALVTAIGTTTLRLPDHLAAELANGIQRLLRSHPPRLDGPAPSQGSPPMR
jgi:hypothetical protein